MRSLVALTLVAACGDALEPPDGELHRYAFTGQRLPRTSSEAKEHAVMMAGGKEVNQLGAVFGTMAAMGLEIDIDADLPYERGDIATRLALQLPAASQQAFAVRLFDAPSTSDTLVGLYDQDPVTESDTATATVAFSILGEVVELEIEQLRVGLDLPIGTELSAYIGGAVRHDDIEQRLAPAVQRAVTAIVARDCTELTTPPACGCVALEADDVWGGKKWLGWFDIRPKDCSITVEEIATNSLVVTMLAADIFVERQPMISFGYRVSAVRIDD